MKGLTVILFLINYNASAFHIVGGEIEMIHLEGFTYRLNVIQYFDRSQQFNPGPESQIFVFTYRVRDQELVRIDTLLLNTQEPVLYTNPECAIAQLQTERVFFTKDVTLDPANFDDPEGYFFVWERCCRNGSVININNPLNTGMTYALQFPPIVKDGEPFVNSSPSLFPPLSDFACVDELYYVDFAGTDFDGDSIVYSLTEPLNSSSTVALPIPQYPDPNRKVVWADGVDNQNIVPGNPSLNISSKGFVTVRPINPGLYVFAALAKEYRNGVQIGEVRRDFQLLVIDGCTPGQAPVVRSQLPDGSLYQEGQLISYTADADKCFEFIVTDTDGEENITLKALGVNFDQDASEIFTFTSGALNSAGDSLKVEVCIPECPFIENGIFMIDLIAMDDACPLPRMDTLRMRFEVQPPPNNNPAFDDSDNLITVNIDEDGFTTFDITGSDADGDTIDLVILNEGFDPAAFGMTFSSTTGDSTLTSTYQLDANCLIYDFGLQNEFNLQVALEDRDQCMINNADILTLDVTVNLPPNTDPVVTTSTGEDVIEVTLDQLLDFDVAAVDSDGDTVKLEAIGEDFDLDDLGIQFASSVGASSTSSSFSWDLTCEGLDLMGREEFTINFVATDQDKCKVPNADTLAVTVKLLIPFNNPPEILGLSDGDVIDVRILEEYVQPLVGTDADGDSILMEFWNEFELPDSETLTFDSIAGVSEVSSILTWKPECSLLGPNRSPREYTLGFILQDNSCPNPKLDTISVTYRVFETPVDFNAFTPPNILTPNGDNMNEVFSLFGNDNSSFNLPPDSCDDRFESVTIVNRYGKSVFESTDRNFVWDAKDFNLGTYYYLLHYTSREIRGTITLMD